MARTKGSMSVSANFEVKAAAPLDARYYVNTKADLTDSTSWVTGGLAYIYQGILPQLPSTDHKPHYHSVVHALSVTARNTCSPRCFLPMRPSNAMNRDKAVPYRIFRRLSRKERDYF